MGICNCLRNLLCLVLLYTHIPLANSDKLLLILVDGCRWDYPDEEPSLRGFQRIAENGVRAPFTVPIFPTNSYPNWYTLVTGLYAESHGFVNNMMYDSYHDDFFLMAPNETASVPHWWNSAEPIWVTAEKQGRKAALYWWDGCQVEIRGRKPSFCQPYQKLETFMSSVNKETKAALTTALDLFQNSEIDLFQVYYEPVDYFGHKYGPESDERKIALKNIDSLLDWFQTEIDQRNLENEVNIVIVSDHGMKSTNARALNIINLAEYVKVDSIRYMIYYGASSMILPEEGHEDTLYRSLKKVPGLNVYKKKEIPDRYHLKNNRLTQPLLLVSKRGSYMKGLDIPGKSIPTGSSISLGSHGYDVDEVPELRGVFFARGPIFQKGHVSQPLHNVDIYNVLCAALNIEPLPNNGSTNMPFLTISNSASSTFTDNAALPVSFGYIFLMKILSHQNF